MSMYFASAVDQWRENNPMVVNESSMESLRTTCHPVEFQSFRDYENRGEWKFKTGVAKYVTARD